MIKKQTIRAILATYEETRNNDNFLIYCLGENYSAKDINNIIRLRAVIQNEDNEFLPTDYKIRIFRKYKSLSSRIRYSNNPLLWFEYYRIKKLYNKIK